MKYSYVGIWRWLWHGIRRPAHKIDLVGDDRGSEIFICTICKIATYDS